MKIIPFEDRYATAFGQLNREWLDHFSLREAADDRHLDAPRESIIARNGQIFFAVEGDEVIGTCAAIPHGEGVFEMAPFCAGQGNRPAAGAAMISPKGPVPEKSGVHGAMGFVHAALPADLSYVTADVYMELEL
jgi:hypothetical protein